MTNADRPRCNWESHAIDGEPVRWLERRHGWLFCRTHWDANYEAIWNMAVQHEGPVGVMLEMMMARTR